jgi:hypothetical protein
MNLVSLAVTALVGTTFSLAAMAQEKANSFDGTWQVHLTCEDTRDRNGALVKGYVFDFPANVKTGELLALRGDEGEASSLRLEGTISVGGEALIQARGYTGKPDYTVGHVRPASPYAYTLRGRFEAKHGHVDRRELRRCSADFERSRDP